MMSDLRRPYRSDNALAAVLDNLAEYWLYRARVAGWAHGTADGITWYHSGQPNAERNAVVRAHLPPEANPAAMVAMARERVSPNGEPWTWWDPPAAVERLLPAAGLRLNSQDTGMTADLARVPISVEAPVGLTIERVRDDAAALSWRLALRAANELPLDVPTTQEHMVAVLRGLAPAGYDEGEPLRLYLAKLGGAPVAVAQLFLGAGVAGIYCVGTLPAVRRQGIGAAVTHAALGHARALGYNMAVLGASELGEPVYRQLGFVAFGKLSEYVWGPEESSRPDLLSPGGARGTDDGEREGRGEM